MQAHEEEDRTPVGRPVFKSGEGRTTSLVGSTPTLFRHAFRKIEKLTSDLASQSWSLKREPARC